MIIHLIDNVLKNNSYSSKYGFEQRAVAQTKQEAIMDPTMANVKQFKQESQRSNIFIQTEISL